MLASNLDQEIVPLFKMLRTPAFRFVLVLHNHDRLVEELIKKITASFPDRPQARLSVDKTDFQTFAKTYEELGSGFLFLEHFEEVVKNGTEGIFSDRRKERIKDLTIGLNLKRDRLAKNPVALISFLSISANEDVQPIRILMQKLPDLWSFRSLILNLEKEIETPSLSASSSEEKERGKTG
ncbi:MAG TPA: hypothetical protein PK509_04475 [Catalimonadaceae bacterium]|nr:hypothetical protein [Catalimonadaceae bacterium]